nr:MAG TPA: hypothetical protein [Caudoviricetes sp.]
MTKASTSSFMADNSSSASEVPTRRREIVLNNLLLSLYITVLTIFMAIRHFWRILTFH